MARRLYSLVTRGIWSDPKFLQLTEPQPNAQTLWLFLLTGDVQGPIPGLFRAGEGTLADALGWPMSAVQAGLSELWEAKLIERSIRPPLIWLPKAIKHNPPSSPNVVKSWGSPFRELPECELRDQAMATIGRALAGSFRTAWEATFPDLLGRKGYRKGSRKGSAKGQAKTQQELSTVGDPPDLVMDKGVADEVVKWPEQAATSSGSGEPKGYRKGSPKTSPNQDPRDKKQETESPHREAARRMGDYLVEAIRSHTPRTAERCKPAGWVDQLEKLMRLDQATEAEVRSMIDYCHRNKARTFWRPNILSGAKLRKQWDRLVIEARGNGWAGLSAGGGAGHWLTSHAGALLRWRDQEQSQGTELQPDSLAAYLVDEGIAPPPDLEKAIRWVKGRP